MVELVYTHALGACASQLEGSSPSVRTLMINFLHHYHPQAILFSIGIFNFYFYGLIMALAIIAGIKVTIILGKKNSFNSDYIIDLSFWLILSGLLGARIYDVLLFLPSYLENPLDILKVWNGGLAIHGGLIGGAIAFYLYNRKKKVDNLKLITTIVPGLALGQAIGRFGNYFNQELFGKPTGLPWGIPIDIWNRPLEFLNYEYFHPTFLYESLACLLIFLVLWKLHAIIKKETSIIIYFVGYSLTRFMLEFIKIDATPSFLGLRWPQVISLLIIITSLIFYNYAKKNKLQKKS